MTHIDLVFHGELEPGFDPQVVKQRLRALLKLTAEQVEPLFSGRRVVLRRGLAADEVERYVAYLSQTVGIRVTAEPHAPKVDTPNTQQAVRAPPSSAEASAKEVACPSCGESQPARNLCRKCAVDMRRFREAQEAIVAEVRAAKLSSARGTDNAVVAGRQDRLRYVLGGLLIAIALVLVARGTIRTAVPAPAVASVPAEPSELIEAVEIYTTHSCSNCAAAKAYMRRNDIRFTEYDVEADQARLKEFYERGGRGVPLIFVHGKAMHGFDPDQFERLRAEDGLT